MKLKILGCGTSTGVPIPGCRCAVCTSENPRNQRMKTSALITSTDGMRRILIDAGTDFRHQALRAQIPGIDAVLFTHSHADHILGIDDLRCYNFVKQGSIPCYGSTETLHEIRRVFAYIFNIGRDYEGGPVPQLDMKEISYLTPFTVEGIEVFPFPLQHGSAVVTGFRVGDLAYATDCKGIPPESIAAMRGVNTLILDGLRFEAHGTHLTIPEAIELSRTIGATATYLTHMTHTVEYDEVSANLPPGVALCYDGLELEIR